MKLFYVACACCCMVGGAHAMDLPDRIGDRDYDGINRCALEFVTKHCDKIDRCKKPFTQELASLYKELHSVHQPVNSEVQMRHRSETDKEIAVTLMLCGLLGKYYVTGIVAAGLEDRGFSRAADEYTGLEFTNLWFDFCSKIPRPQNLIISLSSGLRNVRDFEGIARDMEFFARDVLHYTRELARVKRGDYAKIFTEVEKTSQQ